MADEINMAALDPAGAPSRDAASGRPRRFDPVRTILDALAAIGTVWILALMLLICADVIGRSFLNAPITGVAEIAAHSVVGIVFLQIGATIYHQRMTRADFLIARLAAAAPGLGRVIEALFALVGAAVMAFIAQAAWPGVWNSLNLREFFGVQGLFTVPTWPFRALIVLGGAAGALGYLAVFVQVLRGRA
jgi:TRAP-type C4-dicarboxylate transport system permease small subunit